MHSKSSLHRAKLSPKTASVNKKEKEKKKKKKNKKKKIDTPSSSGVFVIYWNLL